MSVLAAAFAAGIWRQKFSWQADYFADLFKIGLLVAISTAVIGFIMWTLTHRKTDSLLRGGMAGALTALVIIALPAMAWRFKTDFLTKFQNASEGLFLALFSSVPSAIAAGLHTFVDMTKASLVAVVASLIVGMACAYFIPGQRNKQTE